MRQIVSQQELEAIRKYERRSNERTLALLAFDLKVRPDGSVCVIEINGSDFGWKGFKKADPDSPIEENLIDYLTSFELPVSVITTDLNDTAQDIAELSNGQIRIGRIQNPQNQEEYARLGLEHRVQSYGVAYSPNNPFPSQQPIPSDTRSFERIIWNKTYRRLVFDESRYLVATPFTVNSIARDKTLTKSMFAGFEEYIPYGIQVSRKTSHAEELRQFFQHARSDKIIIKPTDSAGGEGIRIVEKKNFVTSSGEIISDIFSLQDEQGPIVEKNRQQVIIEEFVESQPIYSNVTGRNHDGCMRYVIALETDHGAVKATHLGGYWRLSPESVFNASPRKTTLERLLKANLSDGALPQKASAEDLHRVQSSLDRVLSMLYRRLITGPIALENGNSLFVTDTSRYTSDTSYLERTGRSIFFKQRRNNKVIHYSLEELRTIPLPKLRQIEAAESLQRGSRETVRVKVMDYKARQQYNGAMHLLDLRDLETKHVDDMQYQEAYATASQVNLRNRERIRDGDLQARLLQYSKGLMHIYTYNTRAITKMDTSTLEEHCAAVELTHEGETYTREELLQRALDFKVMVTEQPLAVGRQISLQGLDTLNTLQLYELALEYGIKQRLELQSSGQGLDLLKLKAALKHRIGENTPTLSVIVDGYQSRDHLQECLDSLRTQRVHGNFEVCLVVDGTDFETRQLITQVQKQYTAEGKTLRVRYTFTDKGHINAYKLGLDMARGEFLYTMHGDDRLHKWRDQEKIDPHLFTYMLAPFKDKKYGIVHSRFDYISQEGIFVGKQAHPIQKETGQGRIGLLFKKELYEALQQQGLAEFNPAAIYHPDTELGLKIGFIAEQQGLRAYHLERTTYDARLHNGETVDTCSAKERREIRDAIKLYHRLKSKH